MSNGDGFAVNDKAVVAVARASGVQTIEDAYPAALLVPTWQALLAGGAVKTPANLDAKRAKVHLLGPHKLELLVPLKLKDGDEVVQSVVVKVDQWTAASEGEIANQYGSEARVLMRALQSAQSQDIVDHEGPSQKPHI
jgi:hypothetical protein